MNDSARSGLAPTGLFASVRCVRMPRSSVDRRATRARSGRSVVHGATDLERVLHGRRDVSESRVAEGVCRASRDAARARTRAVRARSLPARGRGRSPRVALDEPQAHRGAARRSRARLPRHAAAARHRDRQQPARALRGLARSRRTAHARSTRARGASRADDVRRRRPRSSPARSRELGDAAARWSRALVRRVGAPPGPLSQLTAAVEDVELEDPVGTHADWDRKTIVY